MASSPLIKNYLCNISTIGGIDLKTLKAKSEDVEYAFNYLVCCDKDIDNRIDRIFGNEILSVSMGTCNERLFTNTAEHLNNVQAAKNPTSSPLVSTKEECEIDISNAIDHYSNLCSSGYFYNLKYCENYLGLKSLLKEMKKGFDELRKPSQKKVDIDAIFSVPKSRINMKFPGLRNEMDSIIHSNKNNYDRASLKKIFSGISGFSTNISRSSDILSGTVEVDTLEPPKKRVRIESPPENHSPSAKENYIQKQPVVGSQINYNMLKNGNPVKCCGVGCTLYINSTEGCAFCVLCQGVFMDKDCGHCCLMVTKTGSISNVPNALCSSCLSKTDCFCGDILGNEYENLDFCLGCSFCCHEKCLDSNGYCVHCMRD